MSLPRNPDDLRGLRAAIWIRESTRGQFDRYGPETQRRLIAAAIARLGLVNTGIEFSVARSGSTVYLHRTMREAIAAAQAGAYDVLVVAYVDRWQRNLRQTLNVLEDELHPAGVGVWFCDEELLSSCERSWDQLVDLAKAAESWLRRHRRRVKEGLAAKLASKRDPGGRPPFGFRRNEGKLIVVDPERIEVAKRAFSLALERLTDRAIAARLGVPLFTVRGILTSPLYVGRLRDGGPANWPPVIDVTTWNAVAQLRAARCRRTPGRPETRRTYLLPMLECAACGRRLVGDKDRYRHINACEPFRAVVPQPERPTRGQHLRIPGQSYPRIDFESLVPLILERVSLGAADIASTVSLYHSMRGPGPDRLAIARIAHERDRAAATFVRDRDMVALGEGMARLDEEERAAKVSVPAEPLPPAEIRRYLEHLPEWWAAVGPEDRKALAETLFAKIRVLGLRKAIIEPTFEAAARGLPEAFGIDEVEMVGARGVGPRLTRSSGIWIPRLSRGRVFVTMGGARPPLLSVRSA
jgi:DNA invertase Pin-like site-specific DNA recombinase